MSLMNDIRRYSAALLPLAGLLACDSPTDVPTGPRPDEAQVVATIEILTPGGGVGIGENAQLTAVPRNRHGEPVNRSVTWASADTSLAVISGAGVLTGLTPGVVTVSARAAGKVSTASVYIRESAPHVTGLYPAAATAGEAAFELTVTGSGFTAGATVRWNGQSRPTRVISRTEVRADILAGDLLAAGNVDVTVANPVTGGSWPSARLTFTVQAPPAVWTTWTLTGDASGRPLPVEIVRRTLPDSSGADRTVVQKALAGTIRIRSQYGETTQWEQVVTVATYDQITGAELKRDSYVWFGTVTYDLWDGSMMLVHGGLPIVFRATHLSDYSFVLNQSLDTAGEVSGAWVYERGE